MNLDVKPVNPPLPFRLYSVEALASAGTNLLITAIFFYTVEKFHWALRQNFLLASAQGVFYIFGAMLAGKLAERFDRHRALAMVYTAMALIALGGWAMSHSSIAVAILLVGYSFTSTLGWPIMESLVTSGVDSHEMSRRVGIYNLVWAVVGSIMLAIDGRLILYWPGGIFLIPFMVHAGSAVAMFAMGDGDGETVGRREGEMERRSEGETEGRSEGEMERRREGEIERQRNSATLSNVAGSPPIRPDVSPSLLPSFSPSSAHTHAHTHPHVDPEPELLRVRTLALWLSRVALPATYIVIFSLMALMPSLPVMKPLSRDTQTVVASAWMATRLLAFIALGLGTWWHTRPRLLLVAAIVMLFAYFGVTVRPSDILGHGSGAVDLGAMIIAQLLLGLALGMIYFGSLYFGMALSDGSTEHGGYHEALIGVGFVVGPGIGAITQFRWPGNVYAGVLAVGALVFVSVMGVVVTSLIGQRMDGES